MYPLRHTWPFSLFTRNTSKPLPEHIVTGKKGEEIAVRYLRKLGYRIHHRNVRLRRDEIDIVAFDPEDRVLVFAEVKSLSRAHEDFSPESNANFRKREKLRRSARRWVAWNHFDGGYRIDLVCVSEGRVVDHFKELQWE